MINVTSKSVFNVHTYYNTTNKVVSVVGVTLTRDVQGSLLICHSELSTNQLGVVYTNKTQTHTTKALCKFQFVLFLFVLFQKIIIRTRQYREEVLRPTAQWHYSQSRRQALFVSKKEKHFYNKSSRCCLSLIPVPYLLFLIKWSSYSGSMRLL